jgi:hypothetical protein
MADQRWEFVTVWPHVGPGYWLHRPRTLVLGDSHYITEPETKLLEPDTTQWVIRNYGCAVRKGSQTFAKLVRVMRWTEAPPSIQQREQFWSEHAFYNFVQNLVGRTPEDRPTTEMWRQGEPAVLEVLSVLRPRLVMGLGGDVWASLPNGFAESVAAVAGERKHYRVYRHDEGEAAVFAIKHPGRGFDYAMWRPFVEEMVRIAISL